MVWVENQHFGIENEPNLCTRIQVLGVISATGISVENLDLCSIIRKNLISGPILSKKDFKMVFNLNKVVLTKRACVKERVFTRWFV